MNEISFQESLDLKNTLYIDVRAPGEYHHDHIPGSINIPVFNDSERSEIGKIYKMTGKDSAIIKGSEIVGNKLGKFIPEILKHKKKNIIIYCFRGGMRSTSITALVNSLGIKSYKLKRGYKGYRHFIIDELESLNVKPRIFILHGLTGTGKTDIINKITNSINLEKMAGHRSSIFGGIGLKQNTQKMFESLLIKKLDELKDEQYLLIEGESQKIGNLHIPSQFFNLMQKSEEIFIKLPIDKRAELLVREYTKNINTELSNIIKIIKSLRTKIGEKNINELINLLKEKKYIEFTVKILEKYYDPRYMHKLDKKKFLIEIDNHNTDNTVKIIKQAIKSHLNII